MFLYFLNIIITKRFYNNYSQSREQNPQQEGNGVIEQQRKGL